MANLSQILEALFFAAQRPLPVKELIGILKHASEYSESEDVAAFAKTKEPEILEAIDALRKQYRESERAFELEEQATGWLLRSKQDYAPWLRQLFPDSRPARLSAPALETLAIIAYRQPITRADIEAVRGVAVDGVMQTILDRGLVKIAGRAEIPGRPLLYETTAAFLEHFDLKNLDELPNAGELRNIRLPSAEPAPTNATPPEQMTLDESPAPAAAAETPAEETSIEATEPEPIAASQNESEKIQEPDPEETGAEIADRDPEGN